MGHLMDIVCERRGYSPEYLADINDASHGLLMDVDVLCDRLHVLHEDGGKIVVLPDFDMDGIMSGVVGFAGLAELGFDVALFIPDPKEGYGFGPSTVVRLVEEYPDVAAILTCDVGITCYEGIACAKGMGVDVLVTDHHKEDASSRRFMEADVVVDPMRADETYAHGGICGAHVLWQCLSRYAETHCGMHDQQQIDRLRVFAGIGTVSDVMPMLFENRELVRDAIAICRLVAEGDFAHELDGCLAYKQAFRGLHDAIRLFYDEGKLSSTLDIDEEFFGYYLAPMFNSVKRMDGDMRTAFGVFFGTKREENVRELYLSNEQRKQVVADALARILAADNPFAPYAYVCNDRPGILGLLAAKLMGISGLPTLVLAHDGSSYHGSGRSPAWYPALSRLTGEKFFAAGHEGAFGVGVTDLRELKSLCAFLSHDVAKVLADMPDEPQESYADYVIATDGTGDTDVDISAFGEFLSDVRRMGPYGRDFPRPEGELRFAPSEGEWTTMGSNAQHVKVTFRYGFELLCWNQAHLVPELMGADEVVVRGHLGRSSFRGRDTINFAGDFVREVKA